MKGSSLNIWFNRNVLFGDELWPQKTYLDVKRVKDGKVKFPRGEDWTQVVEVTAESEVVPDNVYIDFRHSRGPSVQATTAVRLSHGRDGGPERIRYRAEARLHG